jgi:hypothetical protein
VAGRLPRPDYHESGQRQHHRHRETGRHQSS